MFEPQTFGALNLTLQRKVFVPHNSDYVRWLNIVSNTGSVPAEVDVSLLGKLASGGNTLFPRSPT